MGDILTAERVVLADRTPSREEAIRDVGRLLVEAGAVRPGYVDSMLERESTVSTSMGNLLATNKQLGMLSFHRVVVNDANKATEEWIYSDPMTLMAQLGVARPVRPARVWGERRLGRGWTRSRCRSRGSWQRAGRRPNRPRRVRAARGHLVRR